MGEQPELWVCIAVVPLSSLSPLQHCLVGGVRGTAAPTSLGMLPRHPPTETVPCAGRSPRDIRAETGTQEERQRPGEILAPRQRLPM